MGSGGGGNRSPGVGSLGGGNASMNGFSMGGSNIGGARSDSAFGTPRGSSDAGPVVGGNGYTSFVPGPAFAFDSTGDGFVDNGNVAPPLASAAAVAYRMKYGAAPYGYPSEAGMLPSGTAFNYMNSEDRAGVLKEAIGARSLMGDWGTMDKVGQFAAKTGIPLAVKAGVAAMPGVGPSASIAGMIPGLLASGTFSWGADKLAKKMGESVAYGLASGNWSKGSMLKNYGAQNSTISKSDNQPKKFNLPPMQEYSPGGQSDEPIGWRTSFGVITPDIYRQLMSNDGEFGVPIDFITGNPGESPRYTGSAGMGGSTGVFGGSYLKDTRDMYNSHMKAMLGVQGQIEGVPEYRKVPTGRDYMGRGKAAGTIDYYKQKQRVGYSKKYENLMNQLGVFIDTTGSGKTGAGWSKRNPEHFGTIFKKGKPEPVFMRDAETDEFVLNPLYLEKYNTNQPQSPPTGSFVSKLESNRTKRSRQQLGAVKTNISRIRVT